jgi:hypothetical protein
MRDYSHSLPITFWPRRSKMVLLLACSSLFVAAGVWMLPRQPIIGMASIIFFGLAAIIFAVTLHPKSAFLTLAPEGFTFASLFRKHFVPWSSVQSFAPARIGLNKMVGWNYMPGFQEHAKLRRANVAISGMEGGLPDTYGMSAEELCGLMNEIRKRHVESEEAP